MVHSVHVVSSVGVVRVLVIGTRQLTRARGGGMGTARIHTIHVIIRTLTGF